jgi:hypothetical protein
MDTQSVNSRSSPPPTRSSARQLRLVAHESSHDPSIELFEYDVKDQKKTGPKNSDVGGQHLGFYVSDLNAAVAHLRRHGVQVLGEPTTVGGAPLGLFYRTVGNDHGARILPAWHGL